MSDVPAPLSQVPSPPKRPRRAYRRLLVVLLLISAVAYVAWSGWSARRMALLVEQIPQAHGRVETVGNPSLLWTWFRAARSSQTLGPHLKSLDAYSQVPSSLGFANATLSDDLAGRIRSAGTVESLTLDNCHLSWSALRELTGLPSLQSLVITNCTI